MSKAIWAAGIVLGLILVAVLLVPALVDVNAFRPEIEARLEKASGHRFQLGNLDLSLTPLLTIRVADIRVANPRPSAAKPLLEAPLLELRINPWSYFGGRVEVQSLRLHRPVITLEPGQAESLGKRQDAPAAAAAQPATAPLSVQDIRIEDLTLVLAGAGGPDAAPELKVEGVDILVPSFRSDQKLNPATAQATVELAGASLLARPFRVPLRIEKGQARVADNRLIVDNLEAALDQTRLDGKIEAAPLDKPAVTFQLHIAELNTDQLDAWIDPQAAKPAAGGTAAGGGKAAADTRIEGDIAVDRLHFGGQRADNLRAHLRMEGTTLRIDKLECDLAEGKAQATGTFQLAEGKPSYQLTSRLRQVNLAPLTAGADKRERITGRLDLDLELSGRGLAFAGGNDLSNLRANGNFSVGQGSILTFNLLERVRLLSLVPFLKVSEGSHTPFVSIRSDFRFDGHRVDTDRMEMQTGPLTLLLSGYFTLGGKLDYLARTGAQAPAGSGNSLVGAILGAVSRNVNLSFRVRGSLNAPEVSPAR